MNRDFIAVDVVRCTIGIGHSAQIHIGLTVFELHCYTLRAVGIDSTGTTPMAPRYDERHRQSSCSHEG
jgi:hypothetical protein